MIVLAISCGSSTLKFRVMDWLAHRYMAVRCAAVAGVPVSQMKAITLQPGNGCSAAAVRSRICAGMKWCGLEMDEGIIIARDTVQSLQP